MTKEYSSLVKTSNNTSGQLQDLVLQDGKHVYEKLAELVNEWCSMPMGEKGYSSVGAVVGAISRTEHGCFAG